MSPAQPPLPTDMNLPFHEVGSQTSALISESLDGVNVTATRQNAGSSLYAGALGRSGRKNGDAGGVNPPRSTISARVTVAARSESARRRPQASGTTCGAKATNRPIATAARDILI